MWFSTAETFYKIEDDLIRGQGDKLEAGMSSQQQRCNLVLMTFVSQPNFLELDTIIISIWNQ